jgi:hypothetical protein
MYRSALGPSRTPCAGGGAGGGAPGGAGGGVTGVVDGGGLLGAQAIAIRLAPTKTKRRIDYSLVLVRPKIATTSVSSLDTLSSFHPRLRMSVRQVISFSHSSAVVRKTRKSATFSQCGGYGEAGGLVVKGEEVVGP